MLILSILLIKSRLYANFKVCQFFLKIKEIKGAPCEYRSKHLKQPPRYSIKKVLLKILRNLKENTFFGVSF